MSHFLFADDSIAFDGQSIDRGPLGGAESAFILMCEALARLGHKISVRNNCVAPLDYRGVNWRPIGSAWPDAVDVYVANRSAWMLDRMPHVQKRIFWIHNPAGYLLKWRYLWRLARFRPTIVFSGDHHAGTYPLWAPPWVRGNSRAVIPYAVSDFFKNAPERLTAPKPKVIFTSNPLRSLDWLLGLWAEKIHPRLPSAELHIFSGAATYKAQGTPLGIKMDKILSQARSLEKQGVVLRSPIAKSQLRDELMSSRALLYRGDVGETFCLALAEAQAMGVPAIVQPIGCVAERIVDQQTGYIANDDAEFVEQSIKVLSDDDLWLRLHRQALKLQQSWSWDRAAAEFASLVM